MGNNLSVLLTTEGTYPFHHGGVSNWCHQLTDQMPDVNFILYSVVVNPYVTQKFTLNSNSKLIRVPLWGTEEPSEHLGLPFSAVYFSKFRTTQKVIDTNFLPLFTNLVTELLALKKDPTKFAQSLIELHTFFKEFDFKISFKSKSTWEMYKEIITEAVKQPKNHLREPDVYSLIQSLGWIYRFFTVLNTPVPKTDVAHSSAAAFCGIPAVISKHTYGTPYLLTEHGVYLREQYLSLSKRGYPSFLNTFLVRMIQSVVTLNYYYADQLSPVCEFNTRWEKKFMPPEKSIEVIYNGIDYNRFRDLRPQRLTRPTAITIARIDPLKDILTLIKAAAIVKTTIPNVHFVIYGSVSVEEYYEQCLQLRQQLDLEDTVTFAGHVDNIPAALQSGDFVVQSSISEAFPYSVVEAMMAGKAVISTDVGGIKEALEDTGILIPPKDKHALANACLHLFAHPELQADLAEQAKERALSLFTLPNTTGKYYKTYIKLALRLHQNQVSQRKPQTIQTIDQGIKKLAITMERGFALLEAGFLEDAVTQFRAAFSLQPSLVVSHFLTEQIHTLEIRQQQVFAERAYCLFYIEKIKEAANQLQHAIQVHPNSLSGELFMNELQHIYQLLEDQTLSEYWYESTNKTNNTNQIKRQWMMAEKGYALAGTGYYVEALEIMQKAIELLPDSPAVPVFVAEMAALLEQADDWKNAKFAWEKFDLLSWIS